MSVATAVAGWALVTAGTPTPSPSTTGEGMPDPDIVTPGALGFVVMFCLAIAIWLLLRNLTGRLRRMRYREEQRQRVEQLAAMEEEDRRWAQAQAAKTAAAKAGDGNATGTGNPVGDAGERPPGSGAPGGPR